MRANLRYAFLIRIVDYALDRVVYIIISNPFHSYHLVGDDTPLLVIFLAVPVPGRCSLFDVSHFHRL